MRSTAGTNAAEFIVSELPSAVSVEEGGNLAGHVMATKEPLSGDAATVLLTPETRLMLEEKGIDPGATCVVPLLANDQSIGTLTVVDSDHHRRRFTDDEVSLLSAFADQAALALEKARLLNEAETERERADALYRVSNLLAGAHDTDEVLDLIVNEATQLVGGKAGFIRLWEGDVGLPTAATASASGYLAEIKALNHAVTVDDNTGAGQVMATMKPLVTEDATTSDWVVPETRLLCEKHGFYGTAVQGHDNVTTLQARPVCRQTFLHLLEQSSAGVW